MFSSVGRITPKLSSARTVIVKALCVAAMMVAISLLIVVLLPIIWPFFCGVRSRLFFPLDGHCNLLYVGC